MKVVMEMKQQDEGRVEEINLGGKRRVALVYTDEELSKMTTGAKEEMKKCEEKDGGCGETKKLSEFPKSKKGNVFKLCRLCFGAALSKGKRLKLRGKRISKTLRRHYKKKANGDGELKEPPVVGLFKKLKRLEDHEKRIARLEKVLFG
jgi:hypothetical protein